MVRNVRSLVFILGICLSASHGHVAYAMDTGIEIDDLLRKEAFLPNEAYAAFMRADGIIEIRDTSHWSIRAFLYKSKKSPQEIFFTATGELLVGIFDRHLSFWHYFDARASYLKNPLTASKALLYAHCRELLSRDARCFDTAGNCTQAAFRC